MRRRSDAPAEVLNRDKDGPQLDPEKELPQCPVTHLLSARSLQLGQASVVVNGTSQRTKSHHRANASSMKLMSVLPDRHFRM
jgi:hypothetical protein